MKIILNEVYNTRLSICEAAKTEPGVLATVQGVFAEYGKKNRNNRFYSKRVWENTLSKPEVQSALAGKRMYMELDHPEEYLEIKIDKTAACVTDLHIDEATSTVQGTLKVLDTPAGRILNTLIRFGSVLGVSSRASGDLDEAGNVDPDTYDFVTFDVVTDPSNSGAHPTLVESVQPGEQRKTLIEALCEAVATADVAQLNIVKTITKQLEENEAAPIINKIEERENELSSNADEKESTDMSVVIEKLDIILAKIEQLLNPASAGEPEHSENPEIVAPKMDESQARVSCKARSKQLNEGTQRETKIVSVSRVITEADVDNTERSVTLIKTMRSK